jgi:hypothetical protein
MWHKLEDFKQALLKWAEGYRIKAVTNETESEFDSKVTGGFLESTRGGHPLHQYELKNAEWYVWIP